MSDAFAPSLFFGFQLIEGKDTLHQMFVDGQGKCEWRPVPTITEGIQTKKDAIAGWIPEEDENIQ